MFSIGNLQFIDTYQFVNKPLDELVKNLTSKNTDSMHHTKNHHKDHPDINLLFRQGYYPYKYMDSPKRFKETSLLPLKIFKLSLIKFEKNNKHYKKAQELWNSCGKFNMMIEHNKYINLGRYNKP